MEVTEHPVYFDGILEERSSEIVPPDQMEKLNLLVQEINYQFDCQETDLKKQINELMKRPDITVSFSALYSLLSVFHKKQ